MTRLADYRPTCGDGLSETSALPAKLGQLMSALADVLEAHRGALDLEDENARKEDEAYRELVERHRAAAGALQSGAERMAGCRGLAMGRHRPAAMASRRAREPLARYVTLEQELLSLLGKMLDRDRALLLQMVGAGR